MSSYVPTWGRGVGRGAVLRVDQRPECRGRRSGPEISVGPPQSASLRRPRPGHENAANEDGCEVSQSVPFGTPLRQLPERRFPLVGSVPTGLPQSAWRELAPELGSGPLPTCRGRHDSGTGRSPAAGWIMCLVAEQVKDVVGHPRRGVGLHFRTAADLRTGLNARLDLSVHPPPASAAGIGSPAMTFASRARTSRKLVSSRLDSMTPTHPVSG